MSLAAVLLVCLGNLFSAGTPAWGAQDQSAPSAQSQAQPQAAEQAPPQSQGSGQEQAPAAAPPEAPAVQPRNAPTNAKPSARHGRRQKKTSTPDCDSPPGASPSSSSQTSTGAMNTSAPATSSDAAAAKPCSPAKVVIKNGGSNEPIVELKGNTTSEQASQQRFTSEQLTASTEANLKKIAGRKLSEGEQETVNQIRQFMEQAKSAIASGDLARGHNLAMKAHLLSEELVKP